jgi:hypothetical protein
MFGFPSTMRVDFVGATALHPELTCTRGSAAWYFDSALQLASVSGNTPRLGAYDFELGTPLGILIEARAITNVCLHCRDLTITHQLAVSSISGAFIDGEAVTSTGGGAGNYIAAESSASIYAMRGGSGTFSGTLTGTQSGATATIGTVTVCWTPTNLTAAKDRTGLDNVASSASSITATGANGTILLARTIASTAYITAAYVKRITGTGGVDMTCDGGTTWTAIDVDTVVSPTGWALVRIPKQTLANPSFGFRLQTSGDAIAVDLVGGNSGFLANQNVICSPILTTTASVTKAADAVLFADIDWFNALEGSWRARCSVPGDPTGASVMPALTFSDATNNNRITCGALDGSGKGGVGIVTGAATQVSLTPGPAYAGGPRVVTVSYKLNFTNAGSDGQKATRDTACTMPAVTQCNLGSLGAGGQQFFGGLELFEYWPRARADGWVIAGSKVS